MARCSGLAILSEDGLIDPSRPGRVGVIEIVEMGTDLGANSRLPAERFADAVYDVATAGAAARRRVADLW